MKTVKLAVSRNGKPSAKKTTKPNRLDSAIDEMRAERQMRRQEIADNLQWVWALDIELGNRLTGIAFYKGKLCRIDLNRITDSIVEPVTLAESAELLIALETCKGVGALGDCDIETSIPGWIKYLELIAKT